MNKQEFLKVCKEAAKKHNNYWSGDTKELNDRTAFICCWHSGGRSGGSCWDTGDSVYYADSGEAPPNSWSLDTFLEETFSNISFLHYKKLLDKIKTDDYTNHEYYGNYTTYTYKYILFEDLFTVLTDLGYIKDES